MYKLEQSADIYFTLPNELVIQRLLDKAHHYLKDLQYPLKYDRLDLTEEETYFFIHQVFDLKWTLEIFQKDTDIIIDLNDTSDVIFILENKNPRTNILFFDLDQNTIVDNRRLEERHYYMMKTDVYHQFEGIQSPLILLRAHLFNFPGNPNGSQG